MLMVDNMAYLGCQDGSIRCMAPTGKDIELENYIICKPHSDCVKKVSMNVMFYVGHDREEYGGFHVGLLGGCG